MGLRDQITNYRSGVDRRKEVMEAATNGIREYLRSTRGAAACGPSAIVAFNPQNYTIRVVSEDYITIYIDSMEA